MRDFRPTYKIVQGPPNVEWSTYSDAVTAQWRTVLSSDPDERTLQVFLEQHPGLLPGLRSMSISSGHSCFPAAAITQPLLSGLSKKIPDFMWLAQSSASIYPVLIEIEKPSKRWFKLDGDPTSDLTHARQQLASWRNWFRNPTHQQWFREYYELTGDIHRHRVIKPEYVLIYGRRSEFDHRPELNKIRVDLQGQDEHFMTYDRLTMDPYATDYVTCRKPTENGFEVVAVPWTLAWGPTYADCYARMSGWENAIVNCEGIPADRRDFLLKRLSYWTDGHDVPKAASKVENASNNKPGDPRWPRPSGRRTTSRAGSPRDAA